MFIKLQLNPSIKLILYVALVVRILFIFINNSILFYQMALVTQIDLNLELTSGQLGFFKCSGNFPGFSSFFISWIIAILYSIFGQSVLGSSFKSFVWYGVSFWGGYSLKTLG